MIKDTNRLQFMLDYQRNHRRVQAESTGQTEVAVTLLGLSPEQRRLMPLLGKFILETGDATPIDPLVLALDWHSWQSPAAAMLEELMYVDVITCDELGSYQLSEFGKMICVASQQEIPNRVL